MRARFPGRPTGRSRHAVAAAGLAALAALAVLGSGPAFADGVGPDLVADAPPPSVAPVAPGATTRNPRTDAECTANFVFTGPSGTYLGVAAHCADTGADASYDGCSATPLPPGSVIRIRRTDGTWTDGTLAYSSWITMQLRGAEDPDPPCIGNDFALVKLPAGQPVQPGVPGTTGPTGVRRAAVHVGDTVWSYQPYWKFEDPAAAWNALKQGRVTFMDDADYHHVALTPAGRHGDSGAGFLDSRGCAFGVLSTGIIGVSGATDLAGQLDYLDAYGGLGQISLVTAGPAPQGGC